MIHAKSAIADGVWARVGSTNLNFASWHFNRELDVVIEDKVAINTLEAQFLQDLSQSTEIVLNETDQILAQHERRRWLVRLRSVNREQAKVVAIRVMHLSHALDGKFYGTEAVDEREGKAYLGLGAALLFMALILWFFPKLLVLPVIFLLAMGGVSTIGYAVKRMQRVKKK